VFESKQSISGRYREQILPIGDNKDLTMAVSTNTYVLSFYSNIR